MKLCPSLLSADFGRLLDDAESVSSLASCFHWDVMDGHFVPNLTFGPPVVNALRRRLALPFDVHLMIDHPSKYAEQFDVGAEDTIIFHVEAPDDPVSTIAAIKRTGARVGVSLRPATPLEALEPFLDAVSYILVMSVEPGFGGQDFLPDALDRIRRLATRIAGRGIDLAVDGGLHAGNVREVVHAGATCIVAGSAIFGAKDRLASMRAMLKAGGDSF
jgi:ribulose-phosphate 3-epimerase